jgi:hypothetical protein
MDGKQQQAFECVVMVANWIRDGKYGTGDDVDSEYLQEDVVDMTESLSHILE